MNKLELKKIDTFSEYLTDLNSLINEDNTLGMGDLYKKIISVIKELDNTTRLKTFKIMVEKTITDEGIKDTLKELIQKRIQELELIVDGNKIGEEVSNILD